MSEASNWRRQAEPRRRSPYSAILAVTAAMFLVVSPGRAQTPERIGAIKLVLTWNSKDDLDLQVVCPNGDRITFDDKIKCRGMLLLDSRGVSTEREPTEIIEWPVEAAPPGNYKVEVNQYNITGARAVAFKVELRIDGVVMETHNASFEAAVRQPGRPLAANPNTQKSVFEFRVPYTRRNQ